MLLSDLVTQQLYVLQFSFAIGYNLGTIDPMAIGIFAENQLAYHKVVNLEKMNNGKCDKRLVWHLQFLEIGRTLSSDSQNESKCTL